MNKYNIIKKLGNGAQGEVQLVEDKVTKELCVVKKMECCDQSEAGKAFNEAVALKNLDHPHICGYKELFVIWEPKDETVYVCIVMDYYKKGDLGLTIESMHAQGEQLEQDVLMAWVGQITEALNHMHGKNLIHRDLKPSNIFLKEDMSIAVGDFGVATMIMGAKNMTRTTVGSINWMAPEVLMNDKPRYDERSDMWSFGCVVMALGVCGAKEIEDVGKAMFDIKTNLQVLETCLGVVKRRYGSEMTLFLRHTMKRNYEQRPSTRDLVDMPFIQHCLQVAGSALYRKDEEDAGQSEEEVVIEPVPTTGGIEAIIAYMIQHKKIAFCQEEALKEILKMEPIPLDDEGRKLLASIMTSFEGSLAIQTLGCQILATIAANIVFQEKDLMFTDEILKPVCLALRYHCCEPGSRSLCAAGATLLMVLASEESAADVIGKLGGVQDILQTMRAYPNDLDIVSDCCTTLWSLSVIDGNLKLMTKECCVKDIYNALVMHGDSKDLVDASCSALWYLSLEDENLSVMADLGIVELFLEIFEKHITDVGVAKLITSTLTSLVGVHEISAFHVLFTQSGLNGIEIMKKALNTHYGDVEVVESIVSLISTLAGYDQVLEELLSLKVQNTLKKLSEKVYAANPQISSESSVSIAISSALQTLLEAAKKPSSPMAELNIESQIA